MNIRGIETSVVRHPAGADITTVEEADTAPGNLDPAEKLTRWGIPNPASGFGGRIALLDAAQAECDLEPHDGTSAKIVNFPSTNE